MNRRSLFRLLGIAPLAVVAPKLLRGQSEDWRYVKVGDGEWGTGIMRLDQHGIQYTELDEGIYDRKAMILIGHDDD